MKIDRLETHDRLLSFQKQSDYISQGCQDCINKRPTEFGNLPFYIFAHKREIALDERYSLYATGQFKTLDEIPTHRMIWVPRLKKPNSQTNSMLFKYYPSSDTIKIVWMIPERETWDQFAKGKITENNLVSESIHWFKNDKKKLEADEEDDLSDEECHRIYSEIARNKKQGEKWVMV